MALTERQQEIQDLLDKNKSPAEIGERLGITTNAVYQQLRRMHKKGGGGRNKSRSRSARPRDRRTSARPSPRAQSPGMQAQLSGSSGNTVAMPTPLQAIRSRRQAIEGELRVSKHRLDEAMKVAARESESHERLQGNRAEELKQLEKAESALTGKPVVRAARSRSRRRSRSTKASSGSNGAGDAKQVRKPAAA